LEAPALNYHGAALSSPSLLKLPHFSDGRGNLTVVEKDLPFSISRTFWISGADGKTRGGHRHHRTRQALVALSGEVSVFLDDGKRQTTVHLDHPSLCLVVEPEDWHTMTFERDAVLLVFASLPYDPADYITEPYV
jgi:dTDP-4-dehydrorhamnose 3,5-epimerase-like enzyme